MRTNPGGSYWGNTFSEKPSFHTAHRGEWICIEFMVKMNSPVTESNGEQAFWIDGVKKNHLGRRPRSKSAARWCSGAIVPGWYTRTSSHVVYWHFDE